jgi:hypothetical protein
MTKLSAKKLKFVKEFIQSLNLNKTFELGFRKKKGIACTIEVYRDNNKSVDFKLLFNSNFFDLFTELDLKHYVLHEIGHLMTNNGPASKKNECMAYEWSHKKAKELGNKNLSREIELSMIDLYETGKGDIYEEAYISALAHVEKPT